MRKLLLLSLLLSTPGTAQTIISDNTTDTPNGDGLGGYFGQIFQAPHNGFLTQVVIEGDAGTPVPTFSLYSDSAGAPGSSLGTLTGPSSYTNGANTYTANLPLTQGTDYFIVGNFSTSGGWAATSSSAGSGPGFLATGLEESPSGASGPWSVAPSFYLQMQVTETYTPVPEINSASAAPALALSITALLMLGDRRRRPRPS